MTTTERRHVQGCNRRMEEILSEVMKPRLMEYDEPTRTAILALSGEVRIQRMQMEIHDDSEHRAGHHSAIIAAVGRDATDGYIDPTTPDTAPQASPDDYSQRWNRQTSADRQTSTEGAA